VGSKDRTFCGDRNYVRNGWTTNMVMEDNAELPPSNMKEASWHLVSNACKAPQILSYEMDCLFESPPNMTIVVKTVDTFGDINCVM
jgi:hypothetical protein